MAAARSSKWYFGIVGAVKQPYVMFGAWVVGKFPRASCGKADTTFELRSILAWEESTSRRFHSEARHLPQPVS